MREVHHSGIARGQSVGRVRGPWSAGSRTTGISTCRFDTVVQNMSLSVCLRSRRLSSPALRSRRRSLPAPGPAPEHPTARPRRDAAIRYVPDDSRTSRG